MINSMLTRQRLTKNLFSALFMAVGFTLGWYTIVRLISPWTVVKTIRLEPAEPLEDSQSRPVGTLRVGCYNIAHGRGGEFGADNWDGGSTDEKLARLEQIADLLRSERLDIIVLNEVDFCSFWSGHIDQSKIIARRAGYPYLIRQKNVDVAIPFISMRFGNVILSRFPITDVVFIDYPNPEWLKGIFVGGIKDGVAATVTLPDGSPLQVVAVHLSLQGEAIRKASVEMMCQLHRRDDIPMLAMGDFNSTAAGFPGYHIYLGGNNSIDTLMADENFETLPNRPTAEPNDLTFPSENPDRVIDWIFVSSGWRIAEKTVLQSDLSDHLPVIAVLKKAGD